MLDSGLFSFAHYRHSPWEVVVLPEEDPEVGRVARVIRPGDYDLYSEAEMRDLAAMYARAQIAAMPIARELWNQAEQRRKERLRDEDFVPVVDPESRTPDLFASLRKQDD